jgi:biopolymer transport protein ExbD
VWNPSGRAPAYADAAGRGEPIERLNITPLIVLMLVMLVISILNLPTLTHELWSTCPSRGQNRSLPVMKDRLVLAQGGGLTLDGVAVDDTALAARLASVVADRQAVLTLRTDPEARYERFDQVLAVVKRAGVTRLGFEGL